jgi:hypothetical protein
MIVFGAHVDPGGTPWCTGGQPAGALAEPADLVEQAVADQVAPVQLGVVIPVGSSGAGQPAARSRSRISRTKASASLVALGSAGSGGFLGGWAALGRGGCGGGVVVAAELGADLGSVGVVQVLQDVQGLLPGVLGGGQVRGGGAGVAEAG